MLIKRLIITSVWQAFLIVFLAVMGIFFMVLLIGELSHIGHGHYTVQKAVVYSALMLPSQLYSLLPMLGFLAALLGLGKLSSQNELIAIRAAGVSRLQIGNAVMIAALVIIVIVTLLGEICAFKWANDALKLKSTALQQKAVVVKTHNVWMKDKNDMIFIKHIVNDDELVGVNIFKFDHNQHLKALINASSADHKGSSWQLNHVFTTTIHNKSTAKTVVDHLSVPLKITPQYLKNNAKETSLSTIKDMWVVMAYRWKKHLPPNTISFAFWLRVCQPFNALIMIWLGIPFVFGTLRNSTMGYRLFIGILIGFAFYMVYQVIGPLCIIYQWPPYIAVFTPTLLLIVLGWYLLKVERQ